MYLDRINVWECGSIWRKGIRVFFYRDVHRWHMERNSTLHKIIPFVSMSMIKTFALKWAQKQRVNSMDMIIWPLHFPQLQVCSDHKHGCEINIQASKNIINDPYKEMIPTNYHCIILSCLVISIGTYKKRKSVPWVVYMMQE